MRTTLGCLKQVIRLEAARAGSQPEQSYDVPFKDDPAYKKRSVLVPDEVKEAIAAWMTDMGLDDRPHARSS